MARQSYYDYGMPMTKEFEGYRNTTYLDTTNNPTIGYGFNLNDPMVRKLVPSDVISGRRTLTTPEADQIFLPLYQRAAVDAVNFVGQDTFNSLSPEDQAILVDLSYNMGGDTLSGFKRFRSALQQGNLTRAAAELKDSKWFKQTGRRARHHVENLGKAYAISK